MEAVVETARGWLVHQARLTSGNDDYRIIAYRHARPILTASLLANWYIPLSLWSQQLQVIDPCVAVILLLNETGHSHELATANIIELLERNGQ